MDLVITHVEINDLWKKDYKLTHKKHYNPYINNVDSCTKNRFTSHGELKYVLRSIAKNMEWVRRVILVVDDTYIIPDWLINIEIVRHSFIMPSSALPTYNSQAIETRLHCIPGISEPFIYFNDDMFVIKPVGVGDLVNLTGQIGVELSTDFSKTGIPNVTEIGFRSSWKNVNTLLNNEFGPIKREKLGHSPYIVSPEVMKVLWVKWNTQLNNTLMSRFRSITDINVAPALHPWYLLHTNNGFRSRLKSETVYLDYHNLDTFKFELGGAHFICLEDDSANSPGSINKNDYLIEDALLQLFPKKCMFEKKQLPPPKKLYQFLCCGESEFDEIL